MFVTLIAQGNDVLLVILVTLKLRQCNKISWMLSNWKGAHCQSDCKVHENIDLSVTQQSITSDNNKGSKWTANFSDPVIEIALRKHLSYSSECPGHSLQVLSVGDTHSGQFTWFNQLTLTHSHFFQLTTRRAIIYIISPSTLSALHFTSHRTSCVVHHLPTITLCHRSSHKNVLKRMSPRKSELYFDWHSIT